jgi:hypothetical protein
MFSGHFQGGIHNKILINEKGKIPHRNTTLLFPKRVGILLSARTPKIIENIPKKIDARNNPIETISASNPII